MPLQPMFTWLRYHTVLEIKIFFVCDAASKGAALLLSGAQPAGRHVIYAAFDRQQHGKQLVSSARFNLCYPCQYIQPHFMNVV